VILLLIPALFLAAASIGAFFGEYVWWLDVLANFRPQFLIALLVSGTALMFSRYRNVAVGILFVAGINLAVIVPLYLGSPGDSRPDAPTVEVMSYNLLSTNDQYAEVADFIRQNEPDLVLLHEASLPWETAMDSAGLDYEVVKARSEDLIFGTLVMVRRPSSDMSVVSFGFAESDPRSVEVVFQPDGWDIPLHVLSSHPLAPTEAPRASLRDAQLEFAANWASSQSEPYLVAGDLNATPWSWPFRNLLEVGRLRNSQIGFGVQPTFAANSNPFFRVPIDHLVQSEGLVVRERALGPAMGSDHFPVLVTLELASD
jgi:endonuclease/exonuclease/phosphatase (EEP) superfamily protein YafD